MTRKRNKDDETSGVTELLEADFSKVAGVTSPANRVPFILLKSRSSAVALRPLVGRAPAAVSERVPDGIRRRQQLEEAARREAEQRRRKAAKHALKARKAAAEKAAKKAASRRVVKAARMTTEATPRYSHEIPATGCVGEADSIMASVTGERTSGLCAARTASGVPCMRPAVGGMRCHLHA